MLDQLGNDPTAPITGMGRRDFERLADRTLLALRPYATSGHARYELPGPSSRSGVVSDGVEAFARSFLAAGFRLSAADSDDHDHAGWYATGLINGTDPDAADAWPTIVDCRQARVEAAAIAIALHESRAWIWDRLDSTAQQRIVDWLAPAATVDYPPSNWLWFSNVTQAFLRSVGAPIDQQRLDDNIEYLDSCYLGDGWYSDGKAGSIDWYNGWVMHLFALWYCRMSSGAPGVDELLDRYRARLRAHLESVSRLFGSDGAPLFQGRSLIYRYAAVGAPWAGAIFDADPTPPGTLRRLAMGSIRYFCERGAFTEDGRQSMGWLGAYEPMRQSYSGPGSPYWSSLGLAGLVIGADDDFWSIPEHPLPVEEGDVAASAGPPGWLISGTRSDGIVRVINHGVDHRGDHENPLYGRLAYSTATAPLDAGPGVIADNQVALVDADGTATERHGFDRIAIGDRTAASAWGPIRCTSVVRGPIEVRVVRLIADQDVDLADRTLVITGFAVPQHPVAGARDDLVAPVKTLLGQGVERAVSHDGDNPFGSRPVINRVEFSPLSTDRPYAVAVALLAGAADDLGWPTVDEADAGVRISWPDGTVDLVE